MTTDMQYRKLMKLIQTEKTLATAAAKAGMDEKTARKYITVGKPPSEVKVDHTWRTRKDPFEEVWEKIEEYLDTNSGLEAKTIFEDLQRRHPGKFSDGQLRTLQRKIKVWRALEGKPKEVMFPQEHTPGKLSQSDFTHMSSLGVTIAGVPFPHMIYHFVLTYSNWETGSICYSESFESLSEGLQNALWELGGVPQEHQTDRLSTAVNNMDEAKEFTQRYKGLLDHYGVVGKKTQADSPNENGDVEQRHHRFKRALDQALMLRGSRDFKTLKEYESFLKNLFKQLNAGRRQRFEEELQVLKSLPKTKLDAVKKLKVRVGPSSTVRLAHNTYSVDSRLIGEMVEARMHMDRIEIFYAQRRVDTFPRLRGENKYLINYRHIIDSLVRKPGAFENYRYRDALFPTSNFRIAYDLLKSQTPAKGTKEYLKILYLAAYEGESKVDEILKLLINRGEPISEAAVKELLVSFDPASFVDVAIAGVDLFAYDSLLAGVV